MPVIAMTVAELRETIFEALQGSSKNLKKVTHVSSEASAWDTFRSYIEVFCQKTEFDKLLLKQIITSDFKKNVITEIEEAGSDFLPPLRFYNYVNADIKNRFDNDSLSKEAYSNELFNAISSAFLFNNNVGGSRPVEHGWAKKDRHANLVGLINAIANISTSANIRKHKKRLQLAIDKTVGNLESPDDVFGKAAFPNDRVEPFPISEPDTDVESTVLQSINAHFNDDVESTGIPMSSDITKILQQLLSQGKYKDVIKPPPKGKIVYRGIAVPLSVLKKDILNIKPSAKINTNKGSMSRKLSVGRPNGSSSSWTMVKKKAYTFADDSAFEKNGGKFKNKGTQRSDPLMMVVFKAHTSDNPNSFLAADDALYKLIVPKKFDEEREVVGLGPIRISSIEWQMW